MKKITFGFKNLEIWNLAIRYSNELFDLSDTLEKDHKFRFAEQLRGAVLSISNNICEGSASSSTREFNKFLTYSRRSLFEVVNILIILNKRGYITDVKLEDHIEKMDELSRKIMNFKKSLLKNEKKYI